MKELEALNKMLGVVLAYTPPRKQKKKVGQENKMKSKGRTTAKTYRRIA